MNPTHEIVERVEYVNMILHSIKRLPPRDAALVLGYLMYGVPQTELGELLEISSTRVKQIIDRSLRKIRRDLSGEIEHESSLL